MAIQTGTPVVEIPHEPVNLIKTAAAMARLMRNKEDTVAGFEVFRWLHGDTMVPAAQAFTASPLGRKLAEDPAYISRALGDLQALRTMPIGSVGWHFARHLDGNGFDPAGIAEIAHAAGGEALTALAEDCPALYRFIDTLNWLHDLMHVLTGYGRDALGEAAILTFIHALGAGRGNGAIAFLTGLKVRAERPAWPVGKVFAHARSMARACPDFLQSDFPVLLDRPLHQVRRELGLSPDPRYRLIPCAARMQVMLPGDAAPADYQAGC